jgi:uncharacterized membrane protein
MERCMNRYRWLLVLPFVWQIALVPLVNDIAWRPFGLPFPMVWQMAGIVFATLVIALVHTLDKRAGR